MPTAIWAPLAIAFVLGILLRLVDRAGRAYRSSLRTYPSRWAFISQNWDVFLLRTVPFNSGLWVLWVFHPGLLAKVLTYLAIPANIANWATIPPTLGTSLGFGFLVDLLLDQLQLKLSSSPSFAWLPNSLKGEIPSYNTDVVDVNKLTPTEKK